MVAYELLGTIFGCAPERGTTILMAYIKVCAGGACDHGTNHVISKYRLLKNKTSIYLVLDLSISFLKNAQIYSDLGYLRIKHKFILCIKYENKNKFLCGKL